MIQMILHQPLVAGSVVDLTAEQHSGSKLSETAASSSPAATIASQMPSRPALYTADHLPTSERYVQVAMIYDTSVTALEPRYSATLHVFSPHYSISLVKNGTRGTYISCYLAA